MPNNALPAVLMISALAFAGCQVADTGAPVDRILDLDADAFAAAEAIEPAGLRRTVAGLSGDEFEGRGPASAGDLKTQAYLADLLEGMGYLPGGENGGWLQSVDVVSITANAPAVWSFVGPGESVELTYWDDFIAPRGSRNRAPLSTTRRSSSSAMAFELPSTAGTGITWQPKPAAGLAEAA